MDIVKAPTALDLEPQVLVVIPAFNEEGSIANVVQQVRKEGLGIVLVVDDGSEDETARAAAQAGAHVLRLPYNLGIGGAVQAGFKYAVDMGFEYVVRLDGDGQHRVEEVRHLLAPVRRGEVDVAIGSRFLPGQHTYSPPRARALGIRWFARLVSWFVRQPTYDPTSGMQALNRRATKVLAENYPQDYPEVEARVLLGKAKLRVQEVRVMMEPRRTGASSITYLRSIYYAFKVTLATFLAALREPPRRRNGRT